MKLLSVLVVAATAAMQPVNVLDGDTIRTINGQRVRIVGLDTPEIHFARCDAEFRLGSVAKRRLEELLSRNAWRLEPFEKADRWGRTLARVFVVLQDGEHDVSQVMIDEGLARPYAGEARQSWCSKLPDHVSPISP